MGKEDGVGEDEGGVWGEEKERKEEKVKEMVKKGVGERK